MGSSVEGDRLERVKLSPQYDGRKFVNIAPQNMPGVWPALWKWVKGAPDREPTEPYDVEALSVADYAVPPTSGLRVTWLGHSTSLIEVDGARVLTDPVWSDRVSPVGWTGPTRFHRPPLAIADLPDVDAVLISHDHYDHLDMPTIKALSGLDTRYVVPLGVGAHLESWGVPAERIVELDWWQSCSVSGLELHAVPARHFSGRGVADRNDTLWAAWAVLGPEHRVFFSGDGGFFDGFKEIGERLGPFDLTLMEIGAYDQLWPDLHMGPEQAVAAHRALRGEVMIPVHWGTFNLALHSWTEPVERLLVEATRTGVRAVVPRPGQRVEPASPPQVARWWPELPWKTAEQVPIRSSGLAGAGEPGAGRDADDTYYPDLPGGS